MAHSYTPGLRVTPYTTLRRRRVLPLKGEVTVRVGDKVSRDQIVAKTDLPGDVATVNVVNRLGIEAGQIDRYMLKKVGEPVKQGEVIAETRPFIKRLKSSVRSPIAGTVENVSSITGQVLLRHPPRPVSVNAYVDGTVVEVIPNEGVVVETQGAFIQGIFGVGGETWGPVRPVANTPEAVISPEEISAQHKGCVLICGSLVMGETVRKAIRVGASGIIGGGIDADDLKDLLGYDLGVAITGTEEIGLTIVVTEGFGKIAMAHHTFDILCGCNGQIASINGATQIRAGVLRPEIIAPCEPQVGRADTGSEAAGGLQIGDPIRVIRAPHFGRIGKVAELPSELQRIESETRVRVLAVEFEGGRKVIVPRANVESITQ